MPHLPLAAVEPWPAAVLTVLALVCAAFSLAAMAATPSSPKPSNRKDPS